MHHTCICIKIWAEGEGMAPSASGRAEIEKNSRPQKMMKNYDPLRLRLRGPGVTLVVVRQNASLIFDMGNPRQKQYLGVLAFFRDTIQDRFGDRTAYW